MLFVSSILHEWREGPKLGPADEQFLSPAIFPTSTPVATNVWTKVDIAWKGNTTLVTTTVIEARGGIYTLYNGLNIILNATFSSWLYVHLLTCPCWLQVSLQSIFYTLKRRVLVSDPASKHHPPGAKVQVDRTIAGRSTHHDEVKTFTADLIFYPHKSGWKEVSLNDN